MYQPYDLPITFTGIENTVQPIYTGAGTRSYDLLITFRCDDGLQGVMENFGECYADDKKGDRVSVRFTGGCMRPAESADLGQWRARFRDGKAPKPTLGQRVQKWLAKRLIGLEPPGGMAQNGTLTYSMKRAPEGYLDVLFLDEDFRITRGNRGSVVIAERVAN